VYLLKDTSLPEEQAHKVTHMDLWHCRFGHPSNQVINQLSIMFGKPLSGKIDLCDVCYRAKQTHLPFPNSENKALCCFDLIHCDIWGAYHVEAFCGARYFLSIIDDGSRGVWVYLVKEKSEASRLVMNFCMMTKA